MVRKENIHVNNSLISFQNHPALRKDQLEAAQPISISLNLTQRILSLVTFIQMDTQMDMVVEEMEEVDEANTVEQLLSVVVARTNESKTNTKSTSTNPSTNQAPSIQNNKET